MDNYNNITEFLGNVIVYGGGSAAAAYALFVFLSKRWLENKFAERLAAYKHEQAKELEETKFKINSLLNRVTKIHEKEFEVLPEAWKMMLNALGLISNMVSLLKQYPDLNGMTQPMLEEFLASAELHEFEKNEIRNILDKNKYYQERIFWHDISHARKAFAEFHNYIQQNAIFLGADLKEQFLKMDSLLRDSMIDYEVGKEAGDTKMWINAWKKIKENAKPIRLNIEGLVQERLRYTLAE